MDDVTDHLRLGEEVRRMQVHLASVVESARDLIISTDPSGAIMTWNSAAELATGHGQDEMRGQLLAEQIDAPQNLEVAECFRQIARIGDLRAVEWPMRCGDGRTIPVSWHLSRMTGTGGEVTGVVVVGRNLVEQRAMEAQMRQAEKLAALGMAIGGIAHEIRNPLGVSSAAAQLMRSCVGSPERIEECIGKVIGGIDRASLVVESLLRFAGLIVAGLAAVLFVSELASIVVPRRSQPFWHFNILLSQYIILCAVAIVVSLGISWSHLIEQLTGQLQKRYVQR